jgi:hypothetical protein
MGRDAEVLVMRLHTPGHAMHARVTRHTSRVTRHTSHVTPFTSGLADDAIADVGSCKLLLSRSCLDDDKEKGAAAISSSSSSSNSNSTSSDHTASSPSLLLPFQSSSSSHLHAALRLCQKLSKEPLPDFPTREAGVDADAGLMQLFCVRKEEAKACGGSDSGGGGGGGGRRRANVARDGDFNHGHLSDAAFDRVCETGNHPLLRWWHLLLLLLLLQ